MEGGDFQAALGELHEALTVFVNGDAEPIKRLHSKRSDLTAFYGWGGYQKGYEAIAGRWDWALPGFHGGEVTYETLSTVEGTELAFAMEIETFSVVFGEDKQSRTWKNNVTHVFVREDGAWRLLHRHASQQPDAPSK